MKAAWLKGTYAKVHCAGAGALVLMTCAVYFGAVQPVLSDKVARLDLEQRMTVERKRASDVGSLISGKSRELEQVNAEIQKAKVQLEAATKVHARVGALTGLAGLCGVEIETVQPEAVRPGNRYGVVPILVRAKGPYVKCTAFLESLARQAKDVGVRSLHLSGNGVVKDDSLKVELELAWYVAPPEKSN